MSRLVDHMTSELGLNQIVVLGFCLGGRYALLLGAHELRLAGVVAYYPTIETPRLPSQEWDVVAQASSIACPVHLITPGIDHLTSRAIFDALQTSLQSRPALTSIQYFPQAEHAFLQTDRRLGPANEQAVGISRAATFGFLSSVLRAKAKEAQPTSKGRGVTTPLNCAKSEPGDGA